MMMNWKILPGFPLTYPFHFRFIEYMPIGISEAGMTSSLYTPEIKQHADRSGSEN